MASLLPSTPTGSRSSSQASFQKKPIPRDKLGKARQLYEKVKYEQRRSESAQFAQGLRELPSQSTITHEHDGNFLDVPVTPLRSRSRSTSSRSSRHSAASSTSSADINDDLSRMTSTFCVDDSKGFKEHHRNPLKPYEKAKAHLVRHLKACPTCRQKKVKCDLDHHDLSLLELEPDSEYKTEPEPEFKAEPTEAPQLCYETPSLRLEIPHSQSRLIDSGVDMWGYNYSPSNSLGFMGSAPELLQDMGASYAPRLDLPQSASEPVPFSNSMPMPIPIPILNAHGSPNTFNMYEETFSDQDITNKVVVGQRYTTAHFGGVTYTYSCLLCQMPFQDQDQCIRHFGTLHFQINSITPCLRLHCSSGKHFCRGYGQFQPCLCPPTGPQNVFLYGQTLECFPNIHQPSSAISNKSYNSSPNSGGHQEFPMYQDPWSSSDYNSPCGSYHFGGAGGSFESGYYSSNTCSQHQSCPLCDNTDPASTSRMRTIRQYTKFPVFIDYLKAKCQFKPRRFELPHDHWIFRYESYFRVASIVSLTLSAMFFGFGEGDYLANKIISLGGIFRNIEKVRLLIGYIGLLICCFAVYRFVRHIWRRDGSGSDRHHSTMSHQCALLKITIPLTRSTSRSMPRTLSPYTGGGSLC